jgi:hypothetical protein
VRTAFRSAVVKGICIRASVRIFEVLGNLILATRRFVVTDNGVVKLMTLVKNEGFVIAARDKNFFPWLLGVG